MQTNRITYLDIAKCVAIFLVLWGHAITQLMNHEITDNRLYMLIYAFHMPLFMTMSGFFASSSMKMSLTELFKKKFKQLIIPALSFGVIWYIHDVIVGARMLSLKSFVHLEAEAYWFLKSLFFAYLIAYITRRFTAKWGGGVKRAFVPLIVCLIFLFAQRYNVTFFKMGSMLPFFYLGMLLKAKNDFITKHKIAIGLSSLIVFIGLFPYFGAEDLFANKFFHTFTLSACSQYAMCILSGLAGTLITIVVCMLIDQYYSHLKIVNLISKIGKYTLGIYLTQKILLELLLPHFLKVEMNIYIYNFLFTFFISIAFLFICYGCTLVLEKFHWTRILFLGKHN